MTRDATGEGELFEQPFHPIFVLRDDRVHFGVGALQIRVGHNPRTAVARTDNVNCVEVVLLDDAVQMGVDEIQSWRGAPVPKEARFDVLESQRSSQERIVVQVDLPDRQVVSRAPVCVQPVEGFRIQSFDIHGFIPSVQRTGVVLVGAEWMSDWAAHRQAPKMKMYPEK